MSEQLGVELVSPEAVTYSGTAEMVVVRTVEGGDIAFCAGHTPFLGVLDIWSIEVVRSADKRDVFAVHRGFVKVSDNKVTILSDVSEPADQIDTIRAENALKRAQRTLEELENSGAEESSAKTTRATTALQRAKLRLRVASTGSNTG